MQRWRRCFQPARRSLVGEALVAAITHICRYVGGSGCFLRPNNVVHHSCARMAPWSCARQSSQRPGGSWTFRSSSNDKCVLPSHNARRSMGTERDCRSVTRIGILAVPVTFLRHHFVACVTSSSFGTFGGEWLLLRLDCQLVQSWSSLA